MKKQSTVWVIVAWWCLNLASSGAAARDPLQAGPEGLEWWRDARFGLFVHWGPVSLMGTEIGWSRGGERRGTGGSGQIPVGIYDNLYREFNPVRFNAREWVELTRQAGMKYLVFTTKHHDGFVMFDSALTDYTIMHSPFRRDVVAELAQACHRAGIRLGFYYSPPDWHHPDYRTENHARYLEYLHGQLRELCSNYGRVDILWFDGLGGSAQDWDSEQLLPMIRALQPGILINNRAGLPADFDTPEQTIGRFQTDRPWESCITLGRQWAWRPGDDIKSLEECIHTLVRCAGGDGNLLLNVGPMPTGEIEPRQRARLRQVGAWLRRYGDTIYGTRGGPWRSTRTVAATHKGNRVYLHLLGGEETVVLPPIDRKIVASSMLTGGRVTLNQTPQRIEVGVPLADRHPLDTIVVLQLDGPAAEAAAGRLASQSVAFELPARASNVHQGMAAYGPDKALDDDPYTRWATDYGVHQAWLEVDLGEPVTIGRAYLSEAYGRVTAFRLERRVGEEWVPFAEGTHIGDDLELTFEPVTARHVRLNILSASEGPTLWEMRLFRAK